MKKIVILLFLFMSMAGIAFPDSGYEWLGRCKEGKAVVKDMPSAALITLLNDELYCDSFVAGAIAVGQAFSIDLEKAGRADLKFFCLPDNYRIKQVRITLTRFMETHPNYLRSQDFELIHMALKEAYPCEKQ